MTAAYPFGRHACIATTHRSVLIPTAFLSAVVLIVGLDHAHLFHILIACVPDELASIICYRHISSFALPS
jgi:hypothetical protein